MKPSEGKPAGGVIVTLVGPSRAVPVGGVNVGAARVGSTAASITPVSGGGATNVSDVTTSSKPPSSTMPVSTPESTVGVLWLLLPQPVIAPTHASVAASDRDAIAAKPLFGPPSLRVISRTPSSVVYRSSSSTRAKSPAGGAERGTISHDLRFGAAVNPQLARFFGRDRSYYGSRPALLKALPRAISFSFPSLPLCRPAVPPHWAHPA